jgi:1-deoxy-D-xylulose-5-phosphate reductoisomerase
VTGPGGQHGGAPRRGPAAAGDGPVAVALVGSTGSIGTQAVDVVRAHPERFRAVALGAHRSVDLLARQAAELRPDVVAIGDPALAGALAAAVPPGTEVLAGTDGLAELACR